MKRRAVVLLSLLALVACTHARAMTPSATATVPNPALNLPQGTVTFTRAGTTELALHVQIAETDLHRQTGLMNVTRMSDRVGMAFLFSLSTSTPFWMKDTLIPLDIAFWDAQGHIVSVFTMTPCTADPCHLYEPALPYVGSAEMNAGLLAAQGIRVGDTATLTR